MACVVFSSHARLVEPANADINHQTRPAFERVEIGSVRIVCVVDGVNRVSKKVYRIFGIYEVPGGRLAWLITADHGFPLLNRQACIARVCLKVWVIGSRVGGNHVDIGEGEAGDRDTRDTKNDDTNHDCSPI